MANRYWVGGTAAWDGTAGTKWALTSGGTGGQAVPTAADDVFFDNLSTGTCTITGSRVAKSINCTGFTGTLAGTSTPALTISGSLTLVAGMTLTYAGTTTFNGTGTLTSGGKTLGNVTVNGSGITVTLGDNLNLGNNDLTVTQGTFTTSASNYSVTAGQLLSSNTNIRTISLNGSTITLSETAVANTINFLTGTNLTFNAGTSQINLIGAAPIIDASGQTFYNVSFTNNNLSGSGSVAAINGANTFNNLTFVERANTGIGVVGLGANQTITGSFSVQSGATSPTKRLSIRSDTRGTARTITSASNTLWGVDFGDITGAGAASWDDSSRTNYWGNCGGTSGITFDAGRIVYWNLAGTQNWSATGWSNLSGGTPNAQYFPLAQDIARFDNSGSVGTVTIDFSWNIGGINMSNRTSAMTLDVGSSPFFIFRNWVNGSGTTLTGSGAANFWGRTTQTITSAGKTFPNGININVPSSTVQLADDITLDSARTLNLQQGTFNANNYNVTTGLFNSNNSNTRTLTMGSGLWTLSGTGTVWALATTTGLTFNKDTANIELSNTTGSSRTFNGGGLAYNKLTIGGATGTSILTINGANTFSELASTKTVAHTITFGADQTITTWSVAGTSGNVITINTDTFNTQRTLTISNRTSGIDYLDLLDIKANLAPVTFYAGANTRLRSNVEGVAAKAPVANEYIYVLDSGTSWTVPADWNNSNNEIHLFAGGGGGAAGRYTSDTNRAGGGGGGGGGYTKVTNVTLTPSSSVSYAIGAAGSAGGSSGTSGTAGGNTTFNSGAYTTTGGGGGSTTATPTSTGGTAGTGSTYNGGVGGQGFTSTTATTACGGGGGAGAGGELGAGANGGNGSGVGGANTASGGGGGGNGGGSVGGNASGTTTGDGGNNANGVGGGVTGSLDGFNGGGGKGATGGSGVRSGFGGSGIDIAKAGMGSGGGGGGGSNGANETPTRGGIFGGGGGGGGLNSTTTARGGANGQQGGIIIIYTATTPPAANSGFFFLFG